jgi:hypothetical protein
LVFVFVLDSSVHTRNTVRLACGIYLRHRSTGVFGTSDKDLTFKENRLIGSPLQVPLMGLDDVTVVLLRDCRLCEWECIQRLPALLEAMDEMPFALHDMITITAFPTVSLDHGLFARASPCFRGEDKHDFVQSLRVDMHDVEYAHYDHLIGLFRMFDPVTETSFEFGIVEPYEEVCELIVPHRSSEKVKTCIAAARKRLSSRVYDRSDGSQRFGRPYVVRDPYFKRFEILHVASMICASHLIQDFATLNCFFVADTTFYYR